MKHDNTNLSNLLSKYSIDNVSANSSEIRVSGAFVAIKGFKLDGNKFIEEAIQNGAKLIFTDSKESYIKYQDLYNIILVENSRKILAEIASQLYPLAPVNLMAVTGTSGKSSVVHYIAQFLSDLGHNASTIGSLGFRIYNPDDKIELLEDIKDTGLTSHDSISFNKALSLFKQKNIDYCALEATSIGLEQYRIYGRKFKVAAFTNFSQDHLDYHHTMEEYLAAKLKLFTSEYLTDDAAIIINSDMKEYPEVCSFFAKLGQKYISIGDGGNCQIQIREVSRKGQSFDIIYNNKIYSLFTSVIGSYQISNIVFAMVMLNKLGINIVELAHIVPKLTAPPGRLEKAENTGKGSRIFIDHSHKPDALEKTLKELKALVPSGGKLIVVFGCGGDRDKLKRPIMGKIACQEADLVIVTDDNPRSEDPSQIRKEILSSCHNNVIEIADRKVAIKYAIENLESNDLLLIAGKGHETYQLVGNKVIPFSDKEVAIEILQI